MNGVHNTMCVAASALLLTAYGASRTARADDVPSPCPALKRIVAAEPQGFSALTPEDGRGIAQPYGSEPRCEVANGTYRCEWTPGGDAGTTSDALEGVAADIAACLPDATHDVNSPARQRFYLGDRSRRTYITVTAAGGGRIRLTVSGR